MTKQKMSKLLTEKMQKTDTNAKESFCYPEANTNES